MNEQTPVNHWEDYGVVLPNEIQCERAPEFCHICGREMVETIEPGLFRSRRTGGPTFVRWHSCPTWVTGWRTKRWASWFALPGRGHDSHDADNPLSSRGYR